jgi:hypothetical protein
MDPEKHWTVSNTAHELGVTPHRVRQMLAEGKLDYVWTPYGRLVSVESVRQLRAAREQARDKMESAHA